MKKNSSFLFFLSLFVLVVSVKPLFAGGLSDFMDRLANKINQEDTASPEPNKQTGSAQTPAASSNPPAPKNYASDLMKASNADGRAVTIQRDGSVQSQVKPESPKQVQGILERAKRTEELNQKLEALVKEKNKARQEGVSQEQSKAVDSKIEETRRQFIQDLGHDPLSKQNVSNQPAGAEPAPELIQAEASVKPAAATAVDEDENGNFDPDKYDEYVEKGGKTDSEGRPAAAPITDGPVPGAGRSVQTPESVPTGVWTGKGNSNGIAVTDAPVNPSAGSNGGVKPVSMPPSGPVKGAKAQANQPLGNPYDEILDGPAPSAPKRAESQAVDEDENGNFDPDKYDEYVEKGGKTDSEGRPTPEAVTDGPVEKSGEPAGTWTGEGNSNGLAVTDAPANSPAPKEHAVDEDENGNFDPDKYDEYVEKGGATDSNGKPTPSQPITDGPVPGSGGNPITDGPVDPLKANPPAAPKLPGVSKTAKDQANQPLGGDASDGSWRSDLQETTDLLTEAPMEPRYEIPLKPFPGASDYADQLARYNATVKRNQALKEEYEKKAAAWEQKRKKIDAKHTRNSENRSAEMKQISEQMRALAERQKELASGKTGPQHEQNHS